MKDGIIIFSRMSSKRLYGKALLDICGIPLLGRIIERASMINNCKIVVATSDSKDDLQIVNYCKALGINYFTGDLNNVMDRAVKCAKYYKFDRFARICGDRPLFPYKMIESFLKIHREQKLDLMTNNFPRTFPKGMTTEIISSKSLSKINKLSLNQYDREHITSFFYRKSKNFKIKLFQNNKDLSNYNFTVDTKEDLIRINWIYSQLNDIFDINLEEITDLFNQWKKIK